MCIFFPQGHRPPDQRPAIVFFFGGGWRSGTPAQFANQCRRMADLGMVAIAADYRVVSRHNAPAVACVADAKSAVRWIRKHAALLGVDPDRIVAAGGSAGGHLAACTGIIDGFDQPGEDLSISSRPNALALFNPPLILAAVEGLPPLEQYGSIAGDLTANRMGVEPAALSPYHHVRGDLPPTIIFHGKADTTAQYWTTEAFTEAMREAGNRCELKGYDGQPHGFFNYGKSNNRLYKATMGELEEFLQSLDYLASTNRNAVSP
jgi:acetyl esterase/lipase